MSDKHCVGTVGAGAHAGEDCEIAWRSVANENRGSKGGEPEVSAKADKWCEHIRGCSALRVGDKTAVVG